MPKSAIAPAADQDTANVFREHDTRTVQLDAGKRGRSLSDSDSLKQDERLNEDMAYEKVEDSIPNRIDRSTMLLQMTINSGGDKTDHVDIGLRCISPSGALSARSDIWVNDEVQVQKRCCLL